MCDFYLNIKESKMAAKNRTKTKRAPWDVNLLIKKLSLKSLRLFIGLSNTFLDTALRNTKIWRSLMSISLITILRSNPAAFALGLNFTYGALALPIAVRTKPQAPRKLFPPKLPFPLTHVSS